MFGANPGPKRSGVIWANVLRDSAAHARNSESSLTSPAGVFRHPLAAGLKTSTSFPRDRSERAIAPQIRVLPTSVSVPVTNIPGNTGKRGYRVMSKSNLAGKALTKSIVTAGGIFGQDNRMKNESC